MASARPIHHDGSKTLAPHKKHFVRPHGQEHLALKLKKEQTKIKMLAQNQFIMWRMKYFCLLSAMHNMHDLACSGQPNTQNALPSDYGTQLETWLRKSSARSDGSNGRSTNGPLRWPTSGQAKETLNTLRSLVRLHAEQVHICSLSEENPVGLSCGLVTTGFWESLLWP